MQIWEDVDPNVKLTHIVELLMDLWYTNTYINTSIRQFFIESGEIFQTIEFGCIGDVQNVMIS